VTSVLRTTGISGVEVEELAMVTRLLTRSHLSGQAPSTILALAKVCDFRPCPASADRVNWRRSWRLPLRRDGPYGAGGISLTHSSSDAGMHHAISFSGSSGLVSRNSSTGLRLRSVRTNGFGPRARIRNWRLDTS